MQIESHNGRNVHNTSISGFANNSAQFSRENRPKSNVYEKASSSKNITVTESSQGGKNPQNGGEAETKSSNMQTVLKSDPLRVFSGNIDRVIKWYKIINFFCIYEVYGPVISLQEGKSQMEKIMLLREKKGQVLQVMYYMTDFIDMQDFNIGAVLRCVGIMIGPNKFRATKIREASDEDKIALQRMCYLSDHTIANAIRP